MPESDFYAAIALPQRVGHRGQDVARVALVSVGRQVTEGQRIVRGHVRFPIGRIKTLNK
jgi:hypothetical protein